MILIGMMIVEMMVNNYTINITNILPNEVEIF
jgi:hypothetical protein